MKRNQRAGLSLGIKLGLACAAVELVLLLLVLGAMFQMSARQLEHHGEVRKAELSHLMSMAFADPLVRKDASEVLDLADRLLEGQSDLNGIEVLDLNGRTMARRMRQGVTSAPLAADIAVGGQNYGKVRFALSDASWMHEHRDLVTTTVGIGITVIVATILLFTFIGHVLTDRLRAITQCADRIAEGDFATPLPDEKNDEVGHLSRAFRIMTAALKQRFDELTAARDAAETANRAKTAFLGTMSHELRTPLNAIIGLAEVAGRNPADGRLTDHLARIKTAGWKLNAIVTDMLEISRLESGHVVTARKPLALTDLTQRLKHEFAADADAKGLDLAIDVQPDIVPSVYLGDPESLYVVLTKLLANALKFTAVGRIALTIERAPPETGSGAIRFAVADTGIGMLPEDQARIFRAFEQADGSLTRRYGGSGLGLPIAQGLVQAMGGTIRVSSELGAGSRFWFDLGLERDPASSEA